MVCIGLFVKCGIENQNWRYNEGNAMINLITKHNFLENVTFQAFAVKDSIQQSAGSLDVEYKARNVKNYQDNMYRSKR